jgi:serine/threonine protein kinase
MRIVGFIAPTKTRGPVVLTEYRTNGSLLDVLTRVERNDPPDFWTETGKLRMILSLVSGLQYLHGEGIVHGELKPSDLIVSKDGSIEISDYLTGFFEDEKYTQAKQVAPPLMVADTPENRPS